MKPSLLVLTLALVAGRVAAQTRPEMVAVVVGANVGDPDDDPLRYAEADARRVRQTLVELGGLSSDRALLVLEGGPNELRQALDEARGRVAELAAAGHPTTLMFYFSGHGDETSLHLPRGNVPLADLRAQLARMPATLRILLLDSCRSVGRAKGVTKGPSFQIGPSPDSPHGSVEVRASALGEGAQESEELGGAIFTHYLVSGLRGGADFDHDGQVTLAEAYSHAFRHTLFRTGGAGSLQHPSLSAELAGAGDVVLTRTSRAVATLEVPVSSDRYLVFALPSAAVIAEVSGEGIRDLALPASRYLVVRRKGASAAVADVDLSWGGHRVLRASEFRPFSREELVARGGHVELRRNRVAVDAGVEFAPRAAEGPALSTTISYTHTRGQLEVGASIGYVGGGILARTIDGWANSLTLRGTSGARFFLGRVTLSGALGLALRWTWESIERRDADRLSGTGFSTRAMLNGGALGPSVVVRLGIPLPRHVVLDLQAAFDALFRDETDGNTTSPSFHPVVALTVGLGRAF